MLVAYAVHQFPEQNGRFQQTRTSVKNEKPIKIRIILEDIRGSVFHHPIDLRSGVRFSKRGNCWQHAHNIAYSAEPDYQDFRMTADHGCRTLIPPG
jgi:hypothetical protein